MIEFLTKLLPTNKWITIEKNVKVRGVNGIMLNPNYNKPIKG